MVEIDSQLFTFFLRYTHPINLFTYQPGFYPRSERVVTATRGFDRGRVEAAAVDAAFNEDLSALVQIQQKAGLDFFSDGLLGWQDIFRPLVAVTEGLESGGIVRWFDNNTFYRVPEVHGPISITKSLDALLPGGSVPAPRVATLPSPYTFSRVVSVASDRNALMLELAREVLAPAARALVGAGCSLVHLQEPQLTARGIEAQDWAPLERALATISEGLGAEVVLHTYFGDAAPFINQLRQLPVHALGVDMVETDVVALGRNWQIGLVAGCLDGRRSLVEPLEETVELIKFLGETINPPTLYLSSNCDLEYLSPEVAEQKVLRLGEVAEQIRQVVRV